MTGREREQRLVCGEIAAEYDAFRPSYPDALFDAVIEFGDLQAGDRALEIGAGTGKATVGFLARGFAVQALEPSPEMAAVLRTKCVEVEPTLFEAWTPPAEGFNLVYAAQAWHWGTRRRPLRTGGGCARPGWHGRVLLERGPPVDRRARRRERRGRLRRRVLPRVEGRLVS